MDYLESNLVTVNLFGGNKPIDPRKKNDKPQLVMNLKLPEFASMTKSQKNNQRKKAREHQMRQDKYKRAFYYLKKARNHYKRAMRFDKEALDCCAAAKESQNENSRDFIEKSITLFRKKDIEMQEYKRYCRLADENKQYL